MGILLPGRNSLPKVPFDNVEMIFIASSNFPPYLVVLTQRILIIFLKMGKYVRGTYYIRYKKKLPL